VWHLISIIKAHLPSVSSWPIKQQLLAVLTLHALLLVALCFRYVPEFAIQLRRKKGAITVLGCSSISSKKLLCNDNTPITPAVSNQSAQISNLVPTKTSKQVSKPDKKLYKITIKKTKKTVSSPSKQKTHIPQKVEIKKTEKSVMKVLPIPEKSEQPVLLPIAPVELQLKANAEDYSLCDSAAPMTPGEVLYMRILAAWKPPRNVRPRGPCVVRILVGRGILEAKPEITSTSGSNAFDMSVRRVLLEVSYPQEVWNRAITIYFS
jgi:hypothetical protein